MKVSTSVNWLENMAFETELNGHKLVIDARSEVGGEDRGPRPKPLMLTSLGGCTGMDVISILKKMRVEVDEFRVEIHADESDEHPVHYTKIHVVYYFKGKDLPEAKIKKAVNLSEERYCGVSHVYKQAIEMTSEIKIDEA